MNGLRYIGQGSYLVGVPARDLAEDDLRELSYTRRELLRSGLYRESVAEGVDD